MEKGVGDWGMKELCGYSVYLCERAHASAFACFALGVALDQLKDLEH